MKVTLPELPDWAFSIERKGCFRYATVRAPNGYTAHVGLHDGNPNNVLFMLVEELIRLDNRATTSSQSSA